MEKENKALTYFKGLKNKNVTIVGIGVSNRPLIDLLLKYGANITVCDKKSYEDLKPTAEFLAQKGVKLCLGDHYLDDLSGEIIFKTPGMRSDLPPFNAARAKGCLVTSEMEVFFSLCPCRIIAVTGSDGKTTTTTLIYNFLKAQGFTCHLGGNIGKPLLPEIFNISYDHFAIVELSSFQLQDMKDSPYIAVVTNVAPNHLDWHKSMDEYIDAKRNIYKYQRHASRLTLNADNKITVSFAKEANGEVNWFSFKRRVLKGVYLNENGDIYHTCDSTHTYGVTDNAISENNDILIMNRDIIKLQGDHNVENYMAAISAVWGLCDIKNITEVASTFNGVEHRMEFIKEHNGVKYYNDSIATSPTRTIACLKSQKQRIILIAGGYDKKVPFEPLAPYIAEKVKLLILTGNTAGKIREAVEKDAGYNSELLEIITVKNLDDAVSLANERAVKGDIVYLSPASASFDSFPNFEVRGVYFKDLVNSLGINKIKRYNSNKNVTKEIKKE